MATIPDTVSQNRHIPHAFKSAAADPWQSQRHQVRAVAKKLAAANDPFTCQKMSFMCALNGGLATDDPKKLCPAFVHQHTSVRCHHFEQQLQGDAARGSDALHVASAAVMGSRAVASASSAATSVSSGRRGGARRTYKRDRYSRDDLDADVTLAKSRVPMPCDDNSHNTARAAAASPAREGVKTASQDVLADKAQDRLLRETGLLYRDGASNRRPDITLDSIPHEEPTYAIRAAKPRPRKHQLGRLSDLDLGLNLSFSDLGDDEGAVQYLLALTASEGDAAGVSSTLSSPTLRAIQEMEDDASSEAWVVLDETA